MGSAPIDRSASWPYEDGEPGAFTYSRFSSPTLAEAERQLGLLDGGDALLFASGTAACTSVILALLSPGQTVALAEGAYYGTGAMLDELARWGIAKIEFDQTGAPPEGVDLVWIEAPSNPFLTMPDFEAAVAHPARVVCDATASTPLNVRPLELGCDIVVHSATKYLAGHDDALVGAAVCKRAEDAARLLEFRSRTGPVPAADTAWLVLRGLQTLEVTDGAPDGDRTADRRSAQGSSRRPDRSLSGIRRAHVVRRRRRGERAARRDCHELIANMTSLGGVTSRIEARERWEGARVPPGLLRVSIGLEDAEDLWSDLEQALAHG